MLIAKFSGNCDDEFDVNGFKLFYNIDKFNAWKSEQIKEFEAYSSKEREFYIGTNESVVLSQEDYFNSITVTILTPAAYDSILEVFGSEYGMFLE